MLSPGALGLCSCLELAREASSSLIHSKPFTDICHLLPLPRGMYWDAVLYLPSKQAGCPSPRRCKRAGVEPCPFRVFLLVSPCFTDEETGSEKVGDFSRATHTTGLVSEPRSL